jgi:putative RecB family exonuclease
MGGGYAPRVTTELEDLGVVPRPNLSYSRLHTYQDCGERYRLTYIEKVPQAPSGALITGRTIHAAIERSEHEGWWQDEAAFTQEDSPAIAYWLTITEKAIEEAGGLEVIQWSGRKSARFPDGEDWTWWRINGQFMLRRYRLTRLAMVENGWGVVEGGVEMQVQAVLHGGVPVVGYLDKFLMHEGGEPLIVDYKAGKIGNLNPYQFATYARLLKLARGIEVHRGVGVFLRAADAERRVQHVEFDGITDHMDEVYGQLARGIEAGDFMAKPSYLCGSCGVRGSCWYWVGTHPEGV